MIKFILTVSLIIVVCVYMPFIPFFIRHFYHIITNAVVDIYKYFKYKKYNECKDYGRIFMVTAHRNKVFGSGKTLDMTMVAAVYSISMMGFLSGLMIKKNLSHSTFT